MNLCWEHTSDHWSKLAGMYRPKFFATKSAVAESNCADHGAIEVFTVGDTHFAIHRYGSSYWKFVYSCSGIANKIYVHSFQYCDKWLANEALGGNAIAVQRIQSILNSVEARGVWRTGR